jgi:AraC-like DNA-binding protein
MVRATVAQRHSSALGSWEMVRAAPAPALRGLVTGYCGYVEDSPGPRRRVEVPSADTTLILSLGPTIDVGYPGRDAGARRHTCFVAPLHDTWAQTSFTGRQEGVEVKLSPLALHMLLGVPMHEIANRVVDLEDLVGREAALLVERLAGLPTWEDRFGALDTALAARLQEAVAPAPSVVWAWRRLRATGGGVPVAALADELGCSRRHLVDGFRRHVGLPPKRVARILRFGRVLRLLEDGGGRSLGDIAASCGYADQPHLNRDFRAFAGASPGDWLARRLPDGAGTAAA